MNRCSSNSASGAAVDHHSAGAGPAQADPRRQLSAHYPTARYQPNGGATEPDQIGLRSPRRLGGRQRDLRTGPRPYERELWFAAHATTSGGSVARRLATRTASSPASHASLCTGSVGSGMTKPGMVGLARGGGDRAVRSHHLGRAVGSTAGGAHSAGVVSRKSRRRSCHSAAISRLTKPRAIRIMSGE